MLKRLMFSALLVAGCSSKAGEPITLRWQLPVGESLAYKVTAEGSTVGGGAAKSKENFSGYLFVDVDSDGSANLRMETGQPIFGVSSMELEAAGSNFFFPLPEVPIAGKPLAQTLTLKGLGSTSNQSNPDIDISETLTKTAVEGDVVHLRFSRRGNAAGGAPITVVLDEEGKGTFDVKAGRYLRLERTMNMSMRGEVGGESMQMAASIKLTLELDPVQSDARTKKRAPRREPPVRPEELAEYLAANPAEVEIAAAVRKLHNSMPTATLVFHLRANAVATWKKAMELPADEREAFISAASFLFGRGRARLPPPVVDWLKSALPAQPALEEAVAVLHDERLREQLVTLAAVPEPDKEWIAKNAGESLRVLDAQKTGPSALLAAGDAELMEVGHALQADGQDLRALVPVLIELLENEVKASSPSGRSPILVQWLEGLAARSLGSDVKAWKVFWEANKDKPYCRWMIEGAGQDIPLLVNHALSRLSSCRESREATDYLATRAQNETGAARDVATLSLAEHADKRAIPVLVELLAGDNPQLRGTALVALANFNDTTLGYDPESDEASRAAALRRWRTWAKTPPAPEK